MIFDERGVLKEGVPFFRALVGDSKGGDRDCLLFSCWGWGWMVM
jgi:hypothetical protein